MSLDSLMYERSPIHVRNLDPKVLEQMDLYAGALYAKRIVPNGTEIRIVSGSSAALNQQEATGLLLDVCKEHFLVADGWFDHAALADEVPLAIMERAGWKR